MEDILGIGIREYFNGKRGEDFTTYLKLPGIGQPIRDTFSPGYFFREYNEMPVLEQQALGICKGSVLDIGSGAGSHSLYLQHRGFDVTAIDKSPGAIATCAKRGIKKVLNKDIMTLAGTNFDTLLLLMNGIGIAGNIRMLGRFLERLASLLAPEGQVILDSSDIAYMYPDSREGTYKIPANGPYYGEGRFVVEYCGKRGAAFDWLYLDPVMLAKMARMKGFNCEVVNLGNHYDYLARLFKR